VVSARHEKGTTRKREERNKEKREREKEEELCCLSGRKIAIQASSPRLTKSND